MRKIFISILSILAGFATILIWEVGTNGNVRFRPWMLEDWILVALILSLFGTPIYFLIKRWKMNFKKNRLSRRGNSEQSDQ